ncbi:MAG: hypothetical protein ACREGC_00205 [Minisyncoccia bacterium]
MDKQTGKLIARIAENLPEMEATTMQGWIENPKSLQKFLLGLNPPEKISMPEPPLDFFIHVDSLVKPTYPDWMEKVMHPELELEGDAGYNLQYEVEQWLHNDQKHGSVVGNTIYKHLQKGDNLATCLNLQDGLAIQAKGIAVFRKLFAGKAVFLWGSVVQNRDGLLLVPYLYENGDKVVVFWNWLNGDWDSNRPALRFSK